MRISHLYFPDTNTGSYLKRKSLFLKTTRLNKSSTYQPGYASIRGNLTIRGDE